MDYDQMPQGPGYSSLGDAVRKCLAGDQFAFNYLYETTYRDKYYIAMKYLDSQADIDEVLQESYAKAYQKLSTLDDPEKFGSWLGMIVANTAKNVLAKNKPLLFSQLDNEDDDGSNIVFDVPDTDISRQPELSYTDEERTRIIRDMIGSLNDEQRMCIMMFYIEGLSIREIAESLDINENTVKSRLNYGRKNIKSKAEEMQKKGYNFFGLAPIVLFILLFRDEAHAMGVEVAVASSTTAMSGASATGASAISGTSGSAAKAGFLTTTAGKGVVISVASLTALGLTFGGVALFNRTRNQNLSPTSNSVVEMTTAEEEQTTSDNEEAELTEEELTTEESVEATTEEEKELTAEDAVNTYTAYLEDTLIPEIGINDVLQTYYSMRPDGEGGVHTKSYNSSTHLVEESYSHLEYDEFDAQARSYSYSGIISIDMDDYDDDGMPEMMVLYGSSDGSIVVETFKTDGENVKSRGALKIDDRYRVEDMSEDYGCFELTTVDGVRCLLVTLREDHTDASIRDHFLLISLKDMENIRGVRSEGPYANNTVRMNYTDYISGGENTKEESLNTVNGGADYDLTVADEYLRNNGFLGDDTKKIAEDLFGLNDYTGFMEKYFFD